MTLGNDWLTPTEFGILNTAFLDDGRTLVLSSGRGQGPGCGREPRHLPGACPVCPPPRRSWMGHPRRYSAARPGHLPWLHSTAHRRRRSARPARTCRCRPRVCIRMPVLGIGYGRPDWAPVGRIIFGYLDAATAAADLRGTPRAGHDRHQPAWSTGPIREARCSQVGGRPRGRRQPDPGCAAQRWAPRRLFDMAFARDMTFAGC